MNEEQGFQSQPDMGECGECGWFGPLSDCNTGKDGEFFKDGFFDGWKCPECQHGEIEELFFSETSKNA